MNRLIKDIDFRYYLATTIFLILIIISIKDYFFKIKIFEIEIKEEITQDNINEIYKNVFKKIPKFDKLKNSKNSKLYYDEKTNNLKDLIGYYYKNNLIEDESGSLKEHNFYVLDMLVNQKFEFYKHLSDFKVYSNYKIPYIVNEEALGVGGCESKLKNKFLYQIVQTCGHVTPARFDGNSLLSVKNDKIKLIVYNRESEINIDYVKWYMKLIEYNNFILSFNDTAIEKNLQILKIVNVKNIKKFYFLKRSTSLLFLYLLIIAIIYLTTKKNKNA